MFLRSTLLFIFLFSLDNSRLLASDMSEAFSAVFAFIMLQDEHDKVLLQLPNMAKPSIKNRHERELPIPRHVMSQITSVVTLLVDKTITKPICTCPRHPPKLPVNVDASMNLADGMYPTVQC